MIFFDVLVFVDFFSLLKERAPENHQKKKREKNMGQLMSASPTAQAEIGDEDEFTMVNTDGSRNRLRRRAEQIEHKNARYRDGESMDDDAREVKHRRKKSFLRQMQETQRSYMARESVRTEIKRYRTRNAKKRAIRQIQRWWRAGRAQFKCPELRVCDEDGLAYTEQEFVKYYRGKHEWNHAHLYIGPPVYYHDEQQHTPMEKRRRRRRRKRLRRKKKRATKVLQRWWRMADRSRGDFVATQNVENVAWRKRHELQKLENFANQKTE